MEKQERLLDNGELSKAFKKLIKAAGLPADFKLYHLRHTCAIPAPR